MEGHLSRSGVTSAPDRDLYAGEMMSKPGLPLRLSFDGVSHRYRGQPALESVTLTLSKGFVGLLGPNGAGKTTLLKLAATVLPLQTGQLEVAGIDVRGPAGRRRAREHLGYLPQQFEIAGSMRVADAVEYAAWAQGLSDRDCPGAASDALQLAGLTELAQRRIRTLSGGQRQRVGIACTLAHQPSILLLDEPTSGLDPEQRSTVRQHLARLAEDRTVIMSTHMLEDVARFCDHLVVLVRGRVRYFGPPAGLAPNGAGLEAIEDSYMELVRGP